ncbi:MAG: ABC transporter permease [Thermomicrobiales bacterium]
MSIRSLLARWETLLLAVLIGLVVLGSAVSDVFFRGSNFTLIAGSTMEKAIMALPMALIIIAGEIDLSVASILGLSSAVLGETWAAGWPLWACIALALLVGALAGLLNGLLVTKLGLPSLVVTLGTLALYRGLAYVILGDQAISDYPAGFASFGFDTIPGTGVPWSMLVFLPLLAIFAVLLHRSWVGRHIYAVGSNVEAARFSAVRVNRIKLWLFVASGTMAAVAGVLYTARVSSSRADNAEGFELDVIAAVLLGGVSIFGGRGTLVGVVLSLAIIATLRDILALTSSNPELQSIAVGSLLILSVLGPTVARRLSRTRSRGGIDAGLRSAAEPDVGD